MTSPPSPTSPTGSATRPARPPARQPPRRHRPPRQRPHRRAPAGEDPVLATVTAIVADLTGYPPELLDPDLDLEADLGVDTVKQAEVFAAVRETYDVDRDATLQLRDFPTLTHVADWVRDKTGQATGPAATPSAPAAPATAAPAAPAGEDPVLATVTAIVADLTGYPPELLDPDLDLEADLGVDTVKQAEVFAAVRETYDVDRDATLQLRDFPTLTHVADWVRDKTGQATGRAPAEIAPPQVEPPRETRPPAPTMETVEGDLRAVDALPRRVPRPALRPSLDDCAPTGVVLDGSRVVVMLDEGGVGTALVTRLEGLGAVPLVIDPGTPTADIEAALDRWLADDRVAGVYWLPAADDEGDHDALDGPAWTEALRRRVTALYTVMRRLWGMDAFLVGATRLGGRHGYDPAGATAPMGGAVTGFAKSYRKERPGAVVKAVDLPASATADTVADFLVEETLRDPGTVEVGRLDGRRWGVVLADEPFPPLGEDGTPDREGGTPLTSDSVVLVTGAAGSIVSAITADLAAAGAGTFHLLDLTPAPDPADSDLADFVTDKDGLKVTIAGRLKESGRKATPVAIERELSRVERLVSAQAAIAAVEAAGGTAHYHCVDLTDADAVGRVVDEIRATSGRVDVLLHAAGLEVSRTLPEKEPQEFALVFDVKTSGWHNLWRAVRDLEVGASVVFSSVAGRFGNAGQTDYAAANDLLCKITSAMRRTRPQTRAHRARLDRLGWHRHGDPRLHPDDHGDGRRPAPPARGRGRLDPPRARVLAVPRRGRRRRDARDDGDGVCRPRRDRAGPARRRARRAGAHGRGRPRERRTTGSSCRRRSTRTSSPSSTTTGSTASPSCPA